MRRWIREISVTILIFLAIVGGYLLLTGPMMSEAIDRHGKAPQPIAPAGRPGD